MDYDELVAPVQMHESQRNKPRRDEEEVKA
jgi:hypothetical protein